MKKLILFLLMIILMTFNVFALGAEILPSNPRDSDDLLCRSTLPTNTQTDFNFRWFRNGQEINRQISVDNTGSHFPATLTSPGDQINCIVSFLTNVIGIDSVTIAGGPNTNNPPKAEAGPDLNGETDEVLRFDGTASSDIDGNVVAYVWNFGDGTTADGKIVNHSYESPGTYTVALTVLDNFGATGEDTATVIIAMSQTRIIEIKNLRSFKDKFETGADTFFRGSPMFTSFLLTDKDGNPINGATRDLKVALRNTATASVTNFIPFNGPLPGSSFGLVRIRNGESCIANPFGCIRINSGTYYFATDTPLTDNFLGLGSINVQIEEAGKTSIVNILNNLPIAEAGGDRIVNTNEAVIFGGIASSDLEDPDQNLKFLWDFGDGNQDVGIGTTHVYTNLGTYLVRLKVTDTEGDFLFDEIKVTVSQTPQRIPPVARFATSNEYVFDFTLFDATRSTDEDGRILSYEWDFGDGNQGAGVQTRYRYEMPGRYLVTLIVTDNDGLAGTESALIEVKYDYRINQEDRPGMPIDGGVDHDKPGADADTTVANMHEFVISGIVPINYKQTYRPGDKFDLLVKVRNTGNLYENLNMITSSPNLFDNQVSSLRISSGSTLLHPVSVYIPNNAKSGHYLLKIEVDNRIGERKETYWQFTVA